MTISWVAVVRRMALVFPCVLSSVAFATTPPVFPVLSYEPYAVAGALAMADGDVNGDGVIDTVYVSAAPAGSSGSTVTSALRSKGGGSPQIVAGGAISCTANSLMLADLNKDGKLDAVVTCAEGSIAVMGGNGDGTFKAASTYTVANAAKAVAADLNGDGFPDVVVALNTGNITSTFAVLLNAGGADNIALGTATVYGGATGSAQLMTGDVNGDGKLDIVAGGDPDILSGASAAVFYGNGDGTFQAASFNGPSNNFTLGDFDGNGVTDIAKMSGDPSYGLATQVTVILEGTTSGGTGVLLPVGIVGLHAVDVNGDGHLDLVVTGSTTTVLLGDGTGNLSIGRSYATPGSYYGFRKGSTGETDLVFATPRGFYTLIGDGKGGFGGLPALFASDIAATADNNGDGLTDFVALEQSAGTQISVLGRGDATFLVLSRFTNQLKGFPVLADFDGDGVVDLVEIYSKGGGDQTLDGESIMAWSKGSGDGRFTSKGTSIDLAVKNAASAVAGDFNGDGKQDLVVAYLDTTAGAKNVSGLVLLMGKGDGTFVVSSAQVATSTTAVSGRPLAADLNGDGKLDIVWGDTAYINQGNGTFSAGTLAVQGTAMAVGDINGDGIVDLVIDNAIHIGNGDGTFQSTALYTIATPPTSTFVSASIGDLNGDGYADVVVQYMADLAGLAVAYGDGTGNFVADSNVYTTGSKTPNLGVLARLNNQSPAQDNRLDYIVFADGAAVSLLNQTNPAPAAAAPLSSKITLSVSSNAIVPLQPVTLSSTITGLNPTGTVTFTLADGTVIGKAAAGLSVAYLQPSFASAGSYTVTATYAGDINNAPSMSNTVSVTVAKGTSAIQVESLPTTYYTGRTVTISVFVTGYNPSAPVVFTSGGTTLGMAYVSGGIASLQYKFSDAGSYPISASYPGDASNLPSSADLGTLTIVPGPDFSMTVTPTTSTVKAGSTTTYTLTITPINGYGGTVQLTCQVVNSGTTCPASQAPVANGQPTVVTFTITPATGGGMKPNLSVYGTIGAAILLFGWKRRWRRMADELYRVALVVTLAVGLMAMSGCSSSASNTGNTNTAVTYSIVLTGTDAGIEATHSVTVQVVVD